MDESTKQLYWSLCEQAAREQDTKKLVELVEQINQLLDQHFKRFEPRTPDPSR